MSLDKMDRYKKEKERRKQGGYKSSKEQSDLKRDTIGAVIVLLILVCAPIGITIYSNHQAAVQQQAQEEFMRQLQDSLATPSDAEAGAGSAAAESASAAEGASEAESEDESVSAASGQEAAGQTDAEQAGAEETAASEAAASEAAE